MLYVFTKNNHDQSNRIFQKIWHKHDYHYELQNITTFWVVWNNDLTTKHNYEMIKSEVRDV